MALSTRDLASWSIPKGLIAEGEPPLVAAKREFNEETGYSPRGETLPLGEARQPGGKTVHVWAVERLGSGRPPEQYVRDGVAAKIRTAVIVSRARRAAWFDLAEVRAKILKGQAVFLVRLLEALAVR